MKKMIRILVVIILAAAFILCVLLSGCTPPQAPLWVAVKSVGGDNGLFVEGQEYSFTLCFGYASSSVQGCQIAVITAKNINNDTAEEENQTFIIEDFSNEKYYKPYKDISAATLELSYPSPDYEPCTGAVIVEIACYKDETTLKTGEYLLSSFCTVYYLADSGIGTIVSYEPENNYWKRRCDILLAKGKLTQNEYESEMHKLQEGPFTIGHQRDGSSEWTETGLAGGGDVSFTETVDGGGVATGTFSTTTDSEKVTVSYLTQLDSDWYDMRYGSLYFKYKQVFSLTAETENGVKTWFVLYKDGQLTLSRPVSGWCKSTTFKYVIVSDSRDGGAETYYKYTDDMTLFEVEAYNS